jgi:hypothetical protein
MPVNSNYVSIVRGFRNDVVGNESYYKASATGMAGANSGFSASVLFKKTLLLAGTPPFSEVLWANIDAANHGWAIGILNDTILEVQVSDAAPSTKAASFDMSQFLGELILATLSVSAGNLELYINGTLVSSVALDVGGYVPSAGGFAQVGMGLIGGVPADPASTCEIAGVGYRPTTGQMVRIFEAAQDAVDLEGGGALISGLELFTNRWSAKDLNQGSTVPKDIWIPRVPAPQPAGTPPLPGTINLIRQGLASPMLLSTVSYKNPLWASNVEAAAASSGFGGPLAYGYFWHQIVSEGEATIAIDAPFPFDTNGPGTAGVVRQGAAPDTFTLVAAGTYDISWMVPVDEPGQTALYVDDPEASGLFPPTSFRPETLAGRATGTSQITNRVIITTAAPNANIRIYNHSSPAALTLTPHPGGTQNGTVSLAIVRLA